MGPRPICRTEHERPAARTPAAGRRVWTDGGEIGRQCPRPLRMDLADGALRRAFRCVCGAASAGRRTKFRTAGRIKARSMRPCGASMAACKPPQIRRLRGRCKKEQALCVLAMIR